MSTYSHVRTDTTIFSNFCGRILKQWLRHFHPSISTSEEHLALFTLQMKKKDNRPTMASFGCLATRPPEGSTRVGILPVRPSLDRGSREAEVRFEPRPFRALTTEPSSPQRSGKFHQNKPMGIYTPKECYCSITVRAK
ncbi:hypothetical protein T265_02019 [Opisthorchis viverrini]|uniref:Uncharacterized protein n=1 Tax=Opisthorchis viverrini TaxID=6198 RepID=A0A075A0L8_OPIVI|nr:hypothetical protein T265_02019 [Opisthorchis viverrini]KER31787.1 hypothetical protein T265_02019 [Opisthorchis viverrini]